MGGGGVCYKTACNRKSQGCVITQSLESIRNQVQEAEFVGPEFRADWKLHKRSESQNCQKQHRTEITVRGEAGASILYDQSAIGITKEIVVRRVTL